MRRIASSLALTAAAGALAACGGGGSSGNASSDGQTVAECVAAWNDAGNASNQGQIATVGVYHAAAVETWTSEEAGGPTGGATTTEPTSGCKYTFHDKKTWVTLSGEWQGDVMGWGIPPTRAGNWNKKLEASVHDNATVDRNGGLKLRS